MMSPTRIGVITGLRKEAGIVRAAWTGDVDDEPLVFAAACNAKTAETKALEMVSQGGAGLLVSFGIAGGLDPKLKPGKILVGTEIIDEAGTRHACDSRLIEALLDLKGVSTSGPILGCDHAVRKPKDKSALFEIHGAIAVDMESHGVARAAAEAGVPFVTLRAVADPADRAIPWAALAGMGKDGSIRIAPVVMYIMLTPWRLNALMRLDDDSGKAFDSLAALDEQDWLGKLAEAVA